MKKISLYDLFITFIKINSITFGGGYTIAPVIMEEFVDKRSLISKKEMLDILALSQTGPGSLAISVSFLTGLRIKGIKGALVSVLAGLIPPVVIISFMYIFYNKFSDNELVKLTFRILSGAVCAILFLSVINLMNAVFKINRNKSIVICVAAFLLSITKVLSTFKIILILIAMGIIKWGVNNVNR